MCEIEEFYLGRVEAGDARQQLVCRLLEGLSGRACYMSSTEDNTQ